MSWNNRIVAERDIPPGDITANPLNWRKHSDYQQQSLDAVINSVGWVQRVIVNETTGHLIDGHLRVQKALEQGEATVPVTYVRLSLDEEKVILASYDPIGAMADTDIEAHRDLIDSIELDDESLMKLLDSIKPIEPSFEPSTFEDQGQLDETQTAPVVCPSCGHEFKA